MSSYNLMRYSSKNDKIELCQSVSIGTVPFDNLIHYSCKYPIVSNRAYSLLRDKRTTVSTWLVLGNISTAEASRGR